MPSGIDIGTAVVNAYLSGVQLRKQNENQAAELELRRQAQEESIKQFNEQLQNHKQEFQTESNLRKAQFEYGQQQAQAQLKFQYATTQNPIAAPGGEGTQQIDTGLGGAPVTAWSPQGLQAYQAKQLEMQGRAAAAQAGAIEEAKLPTQIKLEQEKGKIRTAEDEVKNQQAIKIEEMKERSAQVLNEATNKARVTAAGIAASARLKAANITNDAASDENIRGAIGDAYSGMLSREAILGMVPKKQQLAIDGAMRKAGIVAIDDKTKEKLIKLQDVANVSKDIEWISDFLKKNGTVAAARSAEFKAKVDGVNLQLPLIAKSVGGDSGVLSNQDIGRATSTIPTLLKDFASIGTEGNINYEEAKNFSRIVKRAVGNNLRGMDPEQMKAKAHTFNLPLPFEEDADEIDLRKKK